jgi:hypothetical protein
MKKINWNIEYTERDGKKGSVMYADCDDFGFLITTNNCRHTSGRLSHNKLCYLSVSDKFGNELYYGIFIDMVELAQQFKDNVRFYMNFRSRNVKEITKINLIL